jgi:MFS family permease
MIATTFALLNSSYTGRERGMAYGIWGAVSGASSAVGPLLGGPLTEFLSWRWIFFVNLPVSVLGIAMGLLVLRDDHTRRTRRIDVTGALVFSAAIGIGAGLLLVFTVVETRITEPLLELALLRNRIFSGVLIAALLLNFAAYVSLTYSSIWMQSVLGLTPVTAGLVALPISGASFVVSAVLGRVMHQSQLTPPWSEDADWGGLGDRAAVLSGLVCQRRREEVSGQVRDRHRPDRCATARAGTATRWVKVWSARLHPPRHGRRR